MEAWIYPNEALGAFRNWMDAHYLPKKYPTYIGNKVKAGVFLQSQAAKLLEAVAPKQLANKPS